MSIFFIPAFTIFFPVEVAIALTGMVHLLNNLFKMTIVGRAASWRVEIKFGFPAINGAFIGATILMYFSITNDWANYSLGEKQFVITPVKSVVAIVMFGFAVLELMPFYKKLEFSDNKLYVGGAIIGFFGGLSGHQGALRSAFLIRIGLTKESFIATGLIIASVVDISRISIYYTKYANVGMEENISILLAAVGAGFVSAFFGKRVLKKITVEIVQTNVTVMIMILAVLMGVGII